MYGLVTAHQFVAGGSIDRVLLIGSETLSRIVDWDDRSTAVLFADGAGAVVIEAADDGGEGSHLLGWDLGCDGSAPRSSTPTSAVTSGWRDARCSAARCA